MRLAKVQPNGDVVTDWTPTGGGAHWTQINETPPNEANYVEDGTPGDKDVWDWEDIGLSGRIVGLQYNLYAKKTDEGSKSMKHNVGDTGTEYQGEEIALTDDYVTHHMPLDCDPNTSDFFTVANFNAKRFGVQVET